MAEAADPKATLSSLTADLVGSTVQATISLRNGGHVTLYLTGADSEKARETAKQALKDALSAL